MSSHLVAVVRNFCLFCGHELHGKKSIARGYGPSCWKKIQPKPAKPYITEVPFTDTGTTDYMAKIYGEFENWSDSF